MTRAATSHPFLDRFAELERALDDHGPAWVRALRREGRERFERLGLPTTRMEEWKNTSLKALEQATIAAAAGAREDGDPASVAAAPPIDGPHIVLGAGPAATVEPAGLPDGVWIGTLAEALERIPERVRPHLEEAGTEDGALEALNRAFLRDGAVVLIPENARIEQPVQIVYRGPAAGAVRQPRTLLVAGRGSAARVVETWVGAGDVDALTNAVTQIVVEDGARLDHSRLQLEGAGTFHLSLAVSRQGRESRYVARNVDLGGRLVRHDTRAVLDGEGATCLLDGLYVTDGRQHVDNHTVLDHARPHCDSRELYKGVLGGRSRSVFSGRIVVRRPAQRTDAKQSNPNLLLSPGALAHTRPQLEIYADDVKCTHGATIGRLDEEAVFYLRSRGIADAAARSLLVYAFVDEVLARFEIEPLRGWLARRVAGRLDAMVGRS